ncbi:MAG: dihydroorotate dehydrogenase electron transfer subunit, partial [Firmicutes bacterium]|nr:dihydroorotate dehydrogenase electron transfer subunit [Bacillota bacterium]
QFVNVELPDLYLRRPISICDYISGSEAKGGSGAETAGMLTLIYKAVGKGTEEMAELKIGQELDLLMPLGHGFNIEKAGERPVLIGGGAGAAPLYYLAKEIIRMNPKAKVTVLLGFNTKDEVLLEKEFAALGHTLKIYTVDGTYGEKGFAPDGLADLAQGGKALQGEAGAPADHGYTYFYACGPMPMFRAVEEKAKGAGEYSFEERMGCGFGACMGCSHKTKNGYKRICKDGPVLLRDEIIWD